MRRGEGHRIALLLAAAAVLEFFVGGSRYRAILPVDWFLLATATVARSGNFVRTVLTGAAAGFMEDAVSQQLLGMNAFAKAILGYALTIVAAYNLPLGFEIGVRARVTSGYPRTAVVGAAYDAQRDLYQPIFGPQNRDNLPVFFQLDARVAKRFRLRSTELELYLDIQNITNRGNPEEVPDAVTVRVLE